MSEEPQDTPGDEEVSAQSGGQDAPDHNPTGLDAARAMAAGLRRVEKRPGSGTRHRPRSTPQRRLSGAHPDGRDPEYIGQTVSRLVSDNGWSADVAVYGVFARWRQIVGSEVAAHTTPERFAEGHLLVRADSTSWATQLRLLAPNLVARLNDELGDQTVLRIDVTGPATPSWQKGRRSVRGGRGPRDTYG